MKQTLREQVAARPHSRLIFVRRPDRRGRPELRAYSATSVQGEESLRQVAFEHHEDLRRLDLSTAGEPLAQPLFLVCTHGKHDPCCARYGRPLFEALAEQVEEEAVWQATHIGGDRFAGNLVCLPHGIYYGRVEREQAGDVLDNHLAGLVELPHYRGRSCHSFAAQAAEREIREQEQLFGLEDLTLVEERETALRLRGPSRPPARASRPRGAGPRGLPHVRLEGHAPPAAVRGQSVIRSSPSRTRRRTSTRRPAWSSFPGSSDGRNAPSASRT